jgi:hypothetical protein
MKVTLLPYYWDLTLTGLQFLGEPLFPLLLSSGNESVGNIDERMRGDKEEE